jgi:hypothetical protein
VIGELQSNMEHHLREEESEIFPAAENPLDARQLDDIADEIAKEKQAATAGQWRHVTFGQLRVAREGHREAEAHHVGSCLAEVAKDGLPI